MTEKRVIFESEEEAKRIIKECFPYREGVTIMSIDTTAENYAKTFKEKGYIRKNPVEEAEEMYNAFSDSDDRCASNILELIIKQHNAIQYFQNQIVELNKKEEKI